MLEEVYLSSHMQNPWLYSTIILFTGIVDSGKGKQKGKGTGAQQDKQDDKETRVQEKRTIDIIVDNQGKKSSKTEASPSCPTLTGGKTVYSIQIIANNNL